MNYEELVRSKAEGAGLEIRMPIGVFRRKSIEGKPVNRFEVHRALLDNRAFCEALRREYETDVNLSGGGQVRFVADTADCAYGEFEVEQGSYTSLARLLGDNPAMAARRGFVERMVGDLLEHAACLNAAGIWHVCFSPDNMLVRTGDCRIMLLSHGSFYLGAVKAKVFYEGFDDYVAPEVMSEGAVDERCDVYSIGRFITYLSSVTDVPYGWRKVAEKATMPLPEDRYQTVEAMAAALRRCAALRHTLVTLAVASVAALLVVGGYFTMMPDTEPVEFVNPVTTQQPDDPLDRGFDPTTELGVVPGDTAVMMSAEQQQQMKEYEEKCEQIFRKMYTKEADRILSKVYNSAYMGSNEKKFVAGSRTTFDELVKVQAELAAKAHLSDARSQRIASEIIDKLTEEKKKALSLNGIQK